MTNPFHTPICVWCVCTCMQIKKYESQRVANKSTYWVIFELIWRDFYRFYGLKHGSRIFFESGPSGETGLHGAVYTH